MSALRPLDGAARGVRSPLDAIALLRREPALRRAALLPLAVSAAALSAGVALVVGEAGSLYALATGWLPVLEASAWYAWLWIAPAKLLLAMVGVVAFLVLAGAVVVLAFLAGNLLAAPFHDLLSRRVERAVTGEIVEVSQPGWRGFLASSGRALLEESKRLAFFLLIAAILLTAGLVIPGAQLVTVPAMAALTGLFLALDYLSYALDRRGLSFAGKVRWARDRASLVAGYATIAFLVCSIPGLNLVAMPLLVTAATLLVVEGS